MSDKATCCGRFEGKVAVITGAGSGIGLATAARMIAEGARVIAVDVVQARLDEAAVQLGAAYVPVVADITKAEGIAAIVAAAGERVDILVNNAGIMDGFLPVTEVDDATWDKIIAVNLTAQAKLMRAFLPGMIAAGHGAIVNLASEAALKICAGVAYTVSKYGVVGLTKHTSTLYAKDGIRCNAVAPGGVATNVEGDFKSQFAAQRIGASMGATMSAVGGILQPDALANAICFLADDVAAAAISGVILPVDAGWSAV